MSDTTQPNNGHPISSFTVSSILTKHYKTFLIVLVVLLQIVILFLLLTQTIYSPQARTNQIIEKATSGLAVPPNEFPQVAVIGDGRNLGDINQIKAGSRIDAEVYKDAQNGDYVLAYSAKLIIYRPSENKVIYDGETPAQKQQITE